MNACSRVVHLSSMDICVGLYQVSMCVFVCVRVSACVRVTQFIVLIVLKPLLPSKTELGRRAAHSGNEHGGIPMFGVTDRRTNN